MYSWEPYEREEAEAAYQAELIAREEAEEVDDDDYWEAWRLECEELAEAA